VLTSVKADLMPTVEDALYRCVQDIIVHMKKVDTTIEKSIGSQELRNILEPAGQDLNKIALQP
jgi:replicative superfamily II helicase